MLTTPDAAPRERLGTLAVSRRIRSRRATQNAVRLLRIFAMRGVSSSCVSSHRLPRFAGSLVQGASWAHRDYLQRNGEKVGLDDLQASLTTRYSGYENVEAKVGIPRIILIAESFPSSVTSTAAFLSGIGLAVKLIQFEVTKFKSMPDGTYTIAFDTLFPPPGMESFISTPRTPTISQVVDQEVVEGEARQQTFVAQIVESGRIPVGATLEFRPPYKISGSEKLNVGCSRTRRNMQHGNRTLGIPYYGKAKRFRQPV
jgi:hypothetical protein